MIEYLTQGPTAGGRHHLHAVQLYPGPENAQNAEHRTAGKLWNIFYAYNYI